MNKFYLFFCIVGIVTHLFWGYVVPIANPGVLVDSFSHRLFILLPFITLLGSSFISKKINIEYVAYFGIFTVTADYCYLVSINNSIFHSTGLYVILAVCLAVINKRPFLLFYAISFSLYCVVSILFTADFLNQVHWGNMLTLILLASFFGLWRIKRLEQLESEYKANLEKSKKLEELNNIAAQAAHDIRSPVMALESFANTFSQLEPSKLKIVSDAAKRVNNIADYLVDEYRSRFSNKIDSNAPNKDIFDEQTVSELIQSLRDEKLLLQSDFRKYKINIHGDIQYKIHDSKLQFELKRMISNLINNSIESFSDSSGKVDIMLSEDNNLYHIQVKDNGIGMPKEILPKIFDRGSTFNKSKGTGLGLAHAKDVVESVKGKISISSKEGFGTLVQIQIPKELGSL